MTFSTVVLGKKQRRERSSITHRADGTRECIRRNRDDNSMLVTRFSSSLSIAILLVARVRNAGQNRKTLSARRGETMGLLKSTEIALSLSLSLFHTKRDAVFISWNGFRTARTRFKSAKLIIIINWSASEIQREIRHPSKNSIVITRIVSRNNDQI